MRERSVQRLRRPLCPRLQSSHQGDSLLPGLHRWPGSRRSGGNAGPDVKSGRQEEKSPLIALLLGFVPGVGAHTTEENQGATHFLAVRGLW